jgi:hypothetical protein
MARHNARFATLPRRTDDLHRPLNVEPGRLRDILCLRDERHVGQQLAFSYQRKRIILDETEITRGLPGKYVDSYEYADGRLEFRWNGISLPYSVFDKDQQRVTHAAITENKHLSAVLAFVREEQNKAPPKARRAGKQRTQYQPTGRRNDGWNSLAARKAKARATSSGEAP